MKSKLLRLLNSLFISLIFISIILGVCIYYFGPEVGKLKVTEWADKNQIQFDLNKIEWRWWSQFELSLDKLQWHEKNINMGFSAEKVNLRIDFLQMIKNKNLPIEIILDKAQVYFYRGEKPASRIERPWDKFLSQTKLVQAFSDWKNKSMPWNTQFSIIIKDSSISKELGEAAPSIATCSKLNAKIYTEKIEPTDIFNLTAKCKIILDQSIVHLPIEIQSKWDIKNLSLQSQSIKLMLAEIEFEGSSSINIEESSWDLKINTVLNNIIDLKKSPSFLPEGQWKGKVQGQFIGSGNKEHENEFFAVLEMSELEGKYNLVHPNFSAAGEAQGSFKLSYMRSKEDFKFTLDHLNLNCTASQINVENFLNKSAQQNCSLKAAIEIADKQMDFNSIKLQLDNLDIVFNKKIKLEIPNSEEDASKDPADDNKVQITAGSRPSNLEQTWLFINKSNRAQASSLIKESLDFRLNKLIHSFKSHAIHLYDWDNTAKQQESVEKPL